ncbi:MAG TPA: hypothetical protein VHJ77_14640 [Vicinamibacterales bacterium]|nr:hypothetical protein [Vicinamibacterales bacterium]
MSEQELLAGFEAASLPDDAFHHEQHVHVAWMFIRRYGMPGALTEFPGALKRFAIAKGKPNLYHETITWAFLLVVAERQARCPAESWQAFAALNGDLLVWKPSVLGRYYEKETLGSELARRVFVMPDRLGPGARGIGPRV